MISKKTGVFVIFLFLIILFSVFIVAENCNIRLRAQCTADPWDNIVMGISDSTNAHGELESASPNYDYVLCCDFPRDTTCDGINKIIGLSANTNAHAEIPTLTDYTSHVCYKDLSCRSTTGNCDSDEIGVLSLTSETNAHIGVFADYSTKICCSFVPQKTAYLADPSSPTVEITEINVNIGTTTVLMVLRNSGLSQGTQVNFEIYENDWFFDDDIRVGADAITGIVDSDGHVNASWTITQSDLDKTAGDYDNFYFIAEGSTSGELRLIIEECDGILLCSDYTTNETCEVDACSAIDNSVPGEITCEGGTICECSWDATNSKCEPLITETTRYCGHCGDSFIMLPWEQCDDGNHAYNDGCSPGCMIEELISGSSYKYCGDNNINLPWEECDDGNEGWDVDSCSPSCKNNSIACDEDGNAPGIGSCSYDENTVDDCSDGFLSYSWEANWTWAPTNSFDSNPGGGVYVFDENDGKWHYDPERLSEDCVSGSKSVPCPAQIELPFFGFSNLIVVVILIALIYFILIRKKKK